MAETARDEQRGRMASHSLYADIVEATRDGTSDSSRRRAERRLYTRGYTVRLSDEILRCLDATSAVPTSDAREPENVALTSEAVRCVDGVLPPSLLARLDALFGPEEGVRKESSANTVDFWSAHAYTTSTPFFSYAFGVREVSAGGGCDGASCLEQLAQVRSCRD